MDPWFENFKLLLTYWLMSNNRDGMPEPHHSTQSPHGHAQEYHQHHSLGGHIHLPMVTQSRSLVPYSTPSNTVAITTDSNGISQSQFIRSDRELSLPTHTMPASSHQSLVNSRDQMQPSSTICTERGHICPTCSKGFKSKQQLAQHSLVHSGIRKHICNFCEKGFKQLCHLQQHIRIHTGEKPYKCTFDGCERAFAQMANLHHHMRNHDEHVRKAASKQFHCIVCHRAYTNESSLKNHTLKMHVHMKPLDHPDILFANMCKQKPQKTDSNEQSNNYSVDLTKESKSSRSSLSIGSAQTGKEISKERRESSFVRYLGEHLRQTLANESQGLLSSSSTTHSLLSLHQALQEQSSLLQQTREGPEQSSLLQQPRGGSEQSTLLQHSRGPEQSVVLQQSRGGTGQSMQEDSSPLHQDRQDYRVEDTLQNTPHSSSEREDIPYPKSRFEGANSFQQSRHEQSLIKNSRVLDHNTLLISERHDRGMVSRNNNSVIHHNKGNDDSPLDGKYHEQNTLLYQNVNNESTGLNMPEERLTNNMEEDSVASRILASTPHDDALKMNIRHKMASASKAVENISSSYDVSATGGIHDHLVHHKDSVIPSMNFAHYSAQTVPFRSYPPLPISMAPPAHLPHFLNSNVGTKLDNQMRVTHDSSSFQRIMGNRHMVNFVSSSSQSSTDTLPFSHPK